MDPMASPTFSPLYRQIKDLLLDGLRGGEWRPGEAIPSEMELAARYRVSQGTVRKAIDELAAERRLLDFRRSRASAELARVLALKPGEPVIMLKRLLVFDGSPVLLEEVWLPGNRFKGVTAAAIVEHQGALYNLFETEYGTRMVRAEERLKAVSADATAARLLEVEPGHALLEVERLSFTYGDTPVEWRKGVYKTDRHYYRSELG